MKEKTNSEIVLIDFESGLRARVVERNAAVYVKDSFSQNGNPRQCKAMLINQEKPFLTSVEFH